MIEQEFYNFCNIERLDTRVKTRWIVVTGPPSSGKTTLIKRMAKEGHEVLHDIAREIIVEKKRQSKLFDERTKQQLIVERQLQKYSSIPINKLALLDYGMPDNLVFQDMAGFSVKLAKKAAELIRYQAVFLLSPLPIEHDGVRNLDNATQHYLFSKILEKYIGLNYNPIAVTSKNINNRLEILKEYLRESA